MRYSKMTYFSYCFSKEGWTDVTGSAVHGFASYFLFCVLASVEMTLLIDMWVTCAVFLLL